jgi:hypothetical protein
MVHDVGNVAQKLGVRAGKCVVFFVDTVEGGTEEERR